MACISLAGVSHTYPGGIKAVNDLDLEVLDGELLVLLGPSGCGKSTTLRLIAGLESPASGSIKLRERDANRTPPHDRDVAMLFQEEALYPHLSVRDNLGFSLQARRRGWLRWRRDPSDASALAVRDRVQEVARKLGLADLLDRSPGALSGGERQRVALGRVLVRGAGIWLLDEPFAHVDARLRTELRRTLQAIHRECPGTTIVYVTHDQAEALALADRVAVMNEGRIEQIGTPHEVYETPKNRFVASFVGDPPMNLAAGEVVGTPQGAQVVGDGWSWSLPGSPGEQWPVGRRVVLGLRPRDLAWQATEASAPAEGVAAAGTVVASERRGEDTYFAIELAGVAENLDASRWWWVRAPAGGEKKRGEKGRISGHRGAAWFDAVTGERV
jgi:multiple sugar transport system ATP-binding protein